MKILEMLPIVVAFFDDDDDKQHCDQDEHDDDKDDDTSFPSYSPSQLARKVFTANSFASDSQPSS